MKRDESVFFFTLVDFLITALFFGLVLYAAAVSASVEANAAEEEAQRRVEALAMATGVSDLTELTDRLSRLGPVKDLEAMAVLVQQAGGVAQVQRGQNLIQSSGGVDSIETAIAKLRREGYGIPPCVYTRAPNGDMISTRIATVRATDATISFESRTPVLDSILRSLGLSFSEVQTLTLRDFRRTFQPVVQRNPGCRYSITLIEDTRYVDARDSANKVFRALPARP